MSVYAMAVCDVCGKEKRSPTAHVNDADYWKQHGGSRPNGWEYHMAHDGDSAASVLFCDKCEAEVSKGAEQKVKELIGRIKS